MRYYTTRGKFRGVHPDLARIGIKEIKINCNEEKIEFIFEGKLLKTFLTNIKKTKHNQFTYNYVKLKIGYFSNMIPGIFTLENLIN